MRAGPPIAANWNAVSRIASAARQVLRRDEARDERLARRVVERDRAGRDAGQNVDRRRRSPAPTTVRNARSERRQHHQDLRRDMTRRRSYRSATTPPTSEKATIGIDRGTRPTIPSASGERVRTQTCQSIADVLHLRPDERHEHPGREPPEVAVAEGV